ncbi:exosporium protein C [Paenibacillus tengchongensis]|uniref:exosporium protein C n=1 Tax=Paenibacillus tengchongensis TaxID=2608684 RepID=UPI00124BCED1|nr:exosporium protein C [Paenibacillus tengchongensis]
MVKTILDYNATVVTPITNGVNFPIPISPAGREIAVTSVYIDPANPAHYPNKVELKATIGVEAQLDTPNVLVRIWRAGSEIFYGLVELENFYNDWGLISLHMVDINAPAGTQNYQLIVENQDTNAQARVVGPVIFSAMAIGG